jgi:hypothetical protein
MKSDISQDPHPQNQNLTEMSRQPDKEYIEQKHRRKITLLWISLGLCLAVLVARLNELLINTGPVNANNFGPRWLLPVIAVLVVIGMLILSRRPRWSGLSSIFCWTALLTMLMVANHLVFDILSIGGLIGDPSKGHAVGVDWPGVATRMMAVGAMIVLARLAMAKPENYDSKKPAAWYGYAAFLLALPYPVIRVIWAFGGTIGLDHAGDGGVGFAPLLFAIPWVLAAILSLFLAAPRPWMPRRFLLVAGWTATILVGTLGPLAIWTIITQLVTNTVYSIPGMALWVPCLFYGSWFLWGIAGAAATYSYQMRSADFRKINDK